VTTSVHSVEPNPIVGRVFCRPIFCLDPTARWRALLREGMSIADTREPETRLTTRSGATGVVEADDRTSAG
jgi:hypothetical protein